MLMDRHARLTEEIGYDNLNGMHFIISSLWFASLIRLSDE
jgi:hypothetical protein